MNNDFPDDCLKGIPNDTFVYPDGAVAAHLFHFQTPKDEIWLEQSINWKDDDGAIDLTLQQRKADNKLQFAYGLAIIPRSEIDQNNKKLVLRDKLSYERNRLENNPYHGNILLKKETPNLTMKLAAAALALAVSEVIKRDSSDFNIIDNHLRLL